MERPSGTDITDKYFRETAQYAGLSGEQTTVLMKAIEEKGKKKNQQRKNTSVGRNHSEKIKKKSRGSD